MGPLKPVSSKTSSIQIGSTAVVHVLDDPSFVVMGPLKPVSFKTSSVRIGSTAAGHIGAAVLSHGICSSRFDLDTVICD